MDRPGLSRSKTTGYVANSYSRPTGVAAMGGGRPVPTRAATTTRLPATATTKPLPTAPGVLRSNTNPLSTRQPGLSQSNIRVYKPLPRTDAGGAAPARRPTVKATAPPPRTQTRPPVASPPNISVKRSNTTPATRTAPFETKPRTAGGGTTQPNINKRLPTPAAAAGGSGSRRLDPIPKVPGPQIPVPPSKHAAALSRSKSENQKPNQTYANRTETVKALKAPLPPIPQGVVAKNLVLASQEDAVVLDGGLPSVTSSHIVRVAESNGICMKEAERALYGRHLPAESRIVWNTTAENDRQMRALLQWVDKVRWGLASLGLHKYMATKARGALIFNVNGRLSNSPETPAVDWITFKDVQKTLDRQLQEYIKEYDPTRYVLVFTFRVVDGGNAIHIWGKKLAIPPSLPATYEKELKDVAKKTNKMKYEIIEKYVSQIEPSGKGLLNSFTSVNNRDGGTLSRGLSITKWFKRLLH
ncbi:hypothetical protein FRB99_008998 [Tulasnella sp. 403]|nr:hypothetical protein FRB99_008998 [Tulasnella sp. 403]